MMDEYGKVLILVLCMNALYGFPAKERCYRMALFAWLDKRIKTLHWYDISVLKVCVAALVLLLAKLWSPLLSLAWQWYAFVFVVAFVYVLYAAFWR